MWLSFGAILQMHYKVAVTKNLFLIAQGIKGIDGTIWHIAGIAGEACLNFYSFPLQTMQFNVFCAAF